MRPKSTPAEEPCNDGTLQRLAWAPQIKLRDCSIGHRHGVCKITGKHRVFVEGGGVTGGTTWLLDDAGFARANQVESPTDAIGPA